MTMFSGIEERAPQVSIIVPVYNSAKYLRECVDSVLNQTFADMELILVDDGSNDGSESICDEYAAKDKRVRVIHKYNGGVSSARNRGIEAAKGTYVVFVDSDDYLPTHSISRRVEAIQREKAELVVARYHQQYINHEKECGIDYYKFESLDDLKDIFILKYYYFSTSWSMIFLREKIGKLRFDETLHYCEDAMFNYQYLASCNCIVTIPEVLYFYRNTQQNSLSLKLGYHKIEAVELQFKTINELFYSEKNKEVFDRYYIHRVFQVVWLYLSRGEDNRETKIGNLYRWFDSSMARTINVDGVNYELYIRIAWKLLKYHKLRLLYTFHQLKNLLFRKRPK